MRLARDVLTANLAAINSYTTLFNARAPSVSQPRSHLRIHPGSSCCCAKSEIGEISTALDMLRMRMFALHGEKTGMSAVSRSAQLSREWALPGSRRGPEKRTVREKARAELERASTFGQKLDVSKKEVCSVSVSPKGAFLATGSKENIIVVWNMATGQRMHELHGSGDWAMSITWSADSRAIATASWDDTAVVWNAATGEPVFSLDGHNDFVEAISWSPDGRSIATVTWAGTTGIWDASTGERSLVLEEHADHVCAAAWSPDSSKVATGSKDRTCAIWDPKCGDLLMKLVGHSAQVSAVTWSSDGSKVATGSWDCTAAIWDVATGAQECVFHGHTRIVNAIAWSPDGHTIVTGSYDKTAILWNVGAKDREAPSLVRVLGAFWSVNSVAWSVDGRSVVTGSDDGTARIFRVCIECAERAASRCPHLLGLTSMRHPAHLEKVMFRRTRRFKVGWHDLHRAETQNQRIHIHALVCNISCGSRRVDPSVAALHLACSGSCHARL